MAEGLTIGQAAAFAGVTIKTVRHYHRLGLVDEPERDGSGYRRYRSGELFRLVQVRTLAAAGVPLAEIADPLDTDPETFAATLDEVRHRLTERIEDLTARRDRLHRLAHGDRALLPDRACAVLERLGELGFDPEYVAGQREALVLAGALVPEIFDSFLTRLEHSLRDPESVELTKRGWDARSWDPGDPRIEELASALAGKLLADRALLAVPTGFGNRSDAASRYAMVNHHREAASIARLNSLIEAKLRAAGIAVPRQ
ncbi:MerR family transcriptional regulator (plasmid) [Streptomyces sp. NBC_00335]|uniref:MerR family transcriptional regulator n=1 Tax=unclassified Streptomyces TaxID=2593676 RepID=UPI00225740E5|nr:MULTISPECIES: MerR family transcriptional regulator [unclassified Streptomyces]MCX5410026.1 MerR family transcriptional regulator [Streptomyces sp. NBC_00086]